MQELLFWIPLALLIGLAVYKLARADWPRPQLAGLIGKLGNLLRWLLSVLRKLTPYLAFLVLGLAMLAGAAYAPALIRKFYHVVPSTGPAATGAEVAAGQQGSGWVPSATVASKFIAFAGMYLLLVLLPWLVQHLTHPAVTRWAKTRYSAAFLHLSLEEQFAVNGRLQLVNAIKAVGAAVFAALVV